MARIGIVGCTLIVGREQVLDILRGNLALGNVGPRNVIAFGREVRVFAVPAVGVRCKAAAHEPRTRRVVDVVHVAVRAEDIPRVELAILIQIQMVFRDEFSEVCRAEMRFPGTEGVLKVERVHTELVRVDDDAILGNFLRDPVMPADGLEPPDLVFVVEGDAVRLIGAILLQKRTEAQHALARGADVGQDEDNDVLLADAAAALLFPILRLAQLDHRVGREHARVRGRGFRRRHADVRGVDAGRGPNAVLRVHARAGRVAHGVLRQCDLHVGLYAFINLRLLVGLDHDQLFLIKMTVVRTGDHRRAVIRRQLTGQYSGAGHNYISVSCRFHRSAAFSQRRQILSASIIFKESSSVKAKSPCRCISPAALPRKNVDRPAKKRTCLKGW